MTMGRTTKQKKKKLPPLPYTRKRCARCHRIRHVSQFNRAGFGLRWCQSKCKPCQRKYMSAYYAKIRAGHKPKPRALRAGEHSALRRHAALWRSNLRQQGFRRSWFTIERLVEMMRSTPKCPACGIRIDYAVRDANPRQPSLDKVSPAKGYVRGNVSIICRGCRRLKGNATPAQLGHILKYMSRAGGLS